MAWVDVQYRAFGDDFAILVQVDTGGVDARETCERIFTATNTYGDLEPALWQQIHACLPGERRHTALSVGDRIRVNGETYECAPIGWRQQPIGEV